ncbi:MAG: hypothetical protein KUG82_18655 [Pseudomonadales bacterium]|nr:hypothetical protein [Pseudomonadales bacterium]
MVLVVFIMSAVALSSVAFIENEDSQFRYNDTQARLQTIHQSVMVTRTFQNTPLLSGFTVDNGVLPENMKALITKPDSFVVYGSQSPIFDATPVDGVNDGVNETALTDDNESLLKGYRVGGYLSVPPSTTPTIYRDTWGRVDTDTDGAGADVDDDEDNFGWQVISDGSVYTTASLGLDGVVGGSSYDTDMSQTTQADDWSVQLPAGWSVSITNNGADITVDASSSRVFKVSLLVFLNNQWRQIMLDPAAPISILAGGATVEFNLSTQTQVPAGKHILVLVDEGGLGSSIPHGNATSDRKTKIINLFPRTLIDDISWVIE